MEKLNSVYLTILGFLGAAGSLIADYLGGWDSSLATLIIFMGIDYVTGILVAAVWKQSPKTASGTLESHAGWKGLIKKGVTLLVVLIGERLDMACNIDIIRNAVIIAFIANELLSIVENAGIMGVPIPDKITEAIDKLRNNKILNNNNKEGQ